MFKVTMTHQIRNGLQHACGSFLDNEHDKGADESHSANMADSLSQALSKTLDDQDAIEMDFGFEEFGLLLHVAILFLEYAEYAEDDEATYQWAKAIEDRYFDQPIVIKE